MYTNNYLNNTNDKILIAESDVQQCTIMKVLAKDFFRLNTISVSSGLEVQSVLSSNVSQFALVLVNAELPNINALQILETIKPKYPEVQFIFFAANFNASLLSLLLKAGAIDYIPKPFEVERLKIAISNALNIRNLQLCKNYESRFVSVLKEGGQIKTYNEIETDILNVAIKLYNGNIAEVARRLGISRTTIYRKVPADFSKRKDA